MTRRQSDPLTPWQALEEQAYHAYCEWPLFLKLRLRQLRAHLPPEAFAPFRRGSEASSGEAESSDSAGTVADDIALLKEYGLILPESLTEEAGDDR